MKKEEIMDNEKLTKEINDLKYKVKWIKWDLDETRNILKFIGASVVVIAIGYAIWHLGHAQAQLALDCTKGIK